MKQAEAADGEDDFLGLSSTSQKPHQRHHVDSNFEDFTISSQQSSRQQQQTAGSFWDDNDGEEDNSNKNDFWNDSSSSTTSSRKKKEPEAVDKILDGIGDMFSIKISDDVHTNVKSNTYYE